MSSTAEEPGRCAVIFNPVKVQDGFQERAGAAITTAGWGEPLWLPTAEDDPGHGMVAEARRAGVELVLAAGGDGTVRIVADGLAGTGIVMGIVPAGTGNLLARNLGLPQDEGDALAAALGPSRRTIDLIEITVDQEKPEHFAVMAGVGVDAMIMDETDPRLKAAVGPAAYFVAAGKALGRLPMKVSVSIDGHKPRHRRTMIVLVGNVGELRGGIQLIPRAQPDDGLLDVFIASPRNVIDWIKVMARVLTRRPRRDDRVEILRGREVSVRLEKDDNYQLDGDMAGTCRRLVARVKPGALTLAAPAGSSVPTAS